MSCTTAADSRRVTVFQWRSMKTKATTDCRITIGTIMISSARAYRPFGITSLKRRPITRLADDMRSVAERIMVMPVSKLVIRGMSSLRRRYETIADPAHRLQKQGIGRIGFDLATQPIDLHVHGTLVHRTVAG